METMNVIAWYYYILRTNWVDLKIVNLFKAIFILSRVYNLLKGVVNARRCHTEGFVRKIIEGLTQHSVVNISQYFPNNCWKSSRVISTLNVWESLSFLVKPWILCTTKCLSWGANKSVLWNIKVKNVTLFTVVTYITALLLKGEAMFIHGTQLKLNWN